MIKKSPPYPGIPMTTDGAGMVAWVETRISQAACAYPITSSTTMAHNFNRAVSNGRTNLWGDELKFLELESEHSSATSCEGFALAGGRVTNFTSGQGLVLMKEVLYTISGKRLPVVFHIGARALTSQSLNVHAGHDDVMAVADTGWGILFGRNAQEAGDLAVIARRAAEEGETPFMNVMDGFLTTHTIETVRGPEEELLDSFVGQPESHIRALFDPNRPIMSGVVQNQDAYMKGKVAQRAFTDPLLKILRDAMADYSELTGRPYDLVQSYRLADADWVIVGMGSMLETAEVAADYMREELGLAVGCLHVTAFRPFPGPDIVEALAGKKGIAVLERMDNPLAQSNPLTAEIKSAFADAATGHPAYPSVSDIPLITSGAAGLGSRDVRVGDLIAAVQNMTREEKTPDRFFSLGIKHETSLDRAIDPDVRPDDAFTMRGHSVGGYGSVTTNKVIATVVADLFDVHVQAYPKYGSEKKGLPTTYYLTISPERIRTHSELKHVNFVPLNDVNAFNLGNPLAGIDDEGIVFAQSPHTDPAEVWAAVPARARDMIRKKRLRLFALDTVKIARDVTSVPSLEQRMQGIVLLGIFLKITPYSDLDGLSDDELFERCRKTLDKFFGKKGKTVVEENLECVKRGYREVFEVPPAVIETEPSKAGV